MVPKNRIRVATTCPMILVLGFTPTRSSFSPTKKRTPAPDKILIPTKSSSKERNINRVKTKLTKNEIPPKVGVFSLCELRSLGLSIKFFCFTTKIMLGNAKYATISENRKTSNAVIPKFSKKKWVIIMTKIKSSICGAKIIKKVESTSKNCLLI